MAKIIPFPVPHRDFDYEMDSCVCCKRIFEDADPKIEILDTQGKKVNYICTVCCSSVINSNAYLFNDKKSFDVT